MKNHLIGIGIGIVIGAAASSTVFMLASPSKPDDGSIVPEFDDVKNIVINGEKMSASEFAEKYCWNKPKHTIKDESYCSLAISEVLAKSRRIGNH